MWFSASEEGGIHSLHHLLLIRKDRVVSKMICDQQMNQRNVPSHLIVLNFPHSIDTSLLI